MPISSIPDNVTNECHLTMNVLYGEYKIANKVLTYGNIIGTGSEHLYMDAYAR